MEQSFEETGIDRFWNHNQRAEFRESLRNAPPIASLTVIRSTLRRAVAMRSITLAEGFVDLLCQLDRRYKTNAQQFVMPKTGTTRHFSRLEHDEI